MPTLQGDGATLEEMQRMSEAANEWMAFVLVTIGVSVLSLLPSRDGVFVLHSLFLSMAGIEGRNAACPR
jgi:hypothetical protein